MRENFIHMFLNKNYISTDIDTNTFDVNVKKVKNIISNYNLPIFIEINYFDVIINLI
jgi:hypothetical protein